VVAVGDALEGHARVSVRAIERTRVILDNAGRPEELLLREDDPSLLAGRKATARRGARRAAAPPDPDAALDQRLKTLNGPDGQGISQILSSARIVPQYFEGQMQGMRVDSIKADSVFQKVGLQNGDVITEVNGIVIDRVEATSAIFDEFATAEQIDIAALRGGSAVKLSASATDLLEQP
jgi:general secretion pathway protein C